ncbi:MAG: SGNH/GDSL hydrolase family protein [Oscillospiraceae bacterium]|nr:SGNH/GDSL hydrolase family protein [Oscillospiraceae bacterium]
MRRVVCFGDSNTYGYDPRSLLGSRYPASVRWTERLHSEDTEVVNLGQNGLSVPLPPRFHALAELLRRTGAADVLTVMLGSNDLLSGASAEETGERMEALLSFLRQNAGGARLALIAPPPMQPGDWVQTQRLIDESGRLGAVYRALAVRCGVLFADAREWNVALSFDGVHFSPEGHAAFADGLRKTLRAAWEGGKQTQ